MKVPCNILLHMSRWRGKGGKANRQRINQGLDKKPWPWRRGRQFDPRLDLGHWPDPLISSTSSPFPGGGGGHKRGEPMLITWVTGRHWQWLRLRLVWCLVLVLSMMIAMPMMTIPTSWPSQPSLGREREGDADRPVADLAKGEGSCNSW